MKPLQPQLRVPFQDLFQRGSPEGNPSSLSPRAPSLTWDPARRTATSSGARHALGTSAWHDAAMREDSSSTQRKRLRVGHVSERSGVNAVRTLLEAHGLVVDEVDARSDYGRDLNADITEGSEITGAVIGIQVKADRRFVRNDIWELPVSQKDRQYWADSTIPIVGILYDPQSGELRWSNLTAFARTDPIISEWPPRPPLPVSLTGSVIRFPKSQSLDHESLHNMIDQLGAYVRQMTSSALLDLFDLDEIKRCRAIFDCWTLGRSDARAFLLLRRSLPSLNGESLRQAIATLCRLTPHPDIFWHDGNWVPLRLSSKYESPFDGRRRKFTTL